MQEIPQTKSDVVSYSKPSTIQPSYQFTPVFQENNTQEVRVTSIAGQYSLFELPVEVMNLSRSELCFTMTSQTSSAVYNQLYLNTVPCFSQIQLLTRKGQAMCDVNNADRVNAILKRACVTLNQMMNQDITSGSYTRINSAGANQRLDGTNVNLPYTEIRYTYTNGVVGIGVDVPPVGTASSAIVFKIPLKCLGLDTILEMDKDLFFGEIVRLRFTWSTKDKIGFTTTAAANNTTGEAAFVANTGTDVLITNLVLRLAMQRDERIVQHVKDKYTSGGISLLIPYITSYARSLGAGANATHSIDLKLDANHGHSLLRVYHSVFLTSGTPGLEYESDNLADAKIFSYYTSLDRKKMQQFDFDTSEGDDYQYHREMLKDTALQNQNLYQYNWFHCDDFSGFKSAEDRRAYLKNVACGLPLSQEKSWSFYSTTNNKALDHLTVVVSQKVVNISPSGISVV